MTAGGDDVPWDGPDDLQRAIAVETYVEPHRGQWAVDIVVVFPDEVVRRRVGTHRTQRRAEIAADWIKRAASRDLEAPADG